MNIDSIIFDLDGTLWDSTESVVIAWNDKLQGNKEIKHDITREAIQGVMGLEIKEIGKKLFPYLSEDIQDHLIKVCCDFECKYLSDNGGSLYENLEWILKDLAERYKLFIVSNCQDGYIEAFFKYHKLDMYFVDYENPGRTGLAKGENIKLIIERNQLKSPVYVGDTEGDLKAARFAGVPFVYASYGFGKVREYDYIVNSIDELAKLIES